MTTIPARLARLSRTSSSPAVARQRVIELYRDWVRAAPEIVDTFGLNVSVGEIRRRIREQFEMNRHVSDPKVIDVLIHKSRVEWQEALNAWKQEPHILGIMLQPKTRPQRTFLQHFYEGRDENHVLPAASGM